MNAEVHQEIVKCNKWVDEHTDSGIHIDCDPPGGECKLEQEKKYGKL